MNRRKFINQGLLGSSGIILAEQILGVRQTFAAWLENVVIPVRESNDFSKLRNEYLLSSNIIYLNHASIGTIPRAVQKVGQQYLDICETNPWFYIWGGGWEEGREETRAKAAKLLHCAPGEMVLTHNTTEGFNLLAQGLQLGKGDEVVFSSLNHPGASVCWFHQAREKGFKVAKFDFPVSDAADMSKQEILDLYDRHISKKTRVLVFPHVDNIIGLRHPAKELTALARSRGVEFVAVDGAQTAGMIPADMKEMDVDFYACSPHKWVQAPKGLGLLYIKEDVQQSVKPMWVTWGQERWKGSARIFEDYGTRNFPEVLTLGDAIDFQNRLGDRLKQERYEQLWQYTSTRVEQNEELVWRSPKSWSLASSVYAVEVKGKKSSELARRLFEGQGIVVRPFSTEGLNTLRISPNLFNTEAEIDKLCEVLLTAAKS